MRGWRPYTGGMADGSRSRASQYARASQRKERRRPTRYDFPAGPVDDAGPDEVATVAVPEEPAGPASRRRAQGKARSPVQDWRVQVADLRVIALVTGIIAVLMVVLYVLIPG